MADIIPFMPSPRSGEPLRAREAATIVIFPGVRYERIDQAEDGGPPQSGERTRRGTRRQKLS